MGEREIEEAASPSNGGVVRGGGGAAAVAGCGGYGGGRAALRSHRLGVAPALEVAALPRPPQPPPPSLRAPGLGGRRLWLACTALSAFSVAPRLLSSAFHRRGKHQHKAPSHDDADTSGVDAAACADGRTIFGGKHDIVTEKDLQHLLQLLDNKECGDTMWQHLIERTTSNMTYKALEP